MKRTAFIYIHGVQPEIKKASNWGYSKKFHERIVRELKHSGQDTSGIKRFEVSWSNVTFRFKKDLAGLQFDTFPKRRGAIKNPLKKFIQPAVVDILYYIKNKGTSNHPGEMIVLERLHNAVKRAKAEGYKKVVIFAHSLGSVAAYDYIFRFRKKYAFPRDIELSALITFGSPIPLFAAGMGYPMNEKIERPNYAKKWVNFWDHDDGVACRCVPHYPKSFAKNFLKDVKVNTAWVNPLKAHQGYWKDKETIKKMAKEILL